MRGIQISRRLVVGLGGTRLTPAERTWLSRYEPGGVILFARNVSGPTQLADLCRELRALLPPGAEIVADHEGGPISVLAAALVAQRRRGMSAGRQDSQ